MLHNRWNQDRARKAITTIGLSSEGIQQKSKATQFFCDLSAMDQGQRKKHSVLVRDLLPKYLEVKELPDGYAFRFPRDPTLFHELSELATLEQLCCPFLTITLELHRDRGPTWLKLTGEKNGVKDFLRAELGI